MLASITPLGEWGRGQRYLVTVIAFLLGSVLGGALVGATAGFAGAEIWPRLGAGLPVRAALLAAVVAAGLVIDLTGRANRLPGPARQVNERWLDRYRGWVYGIGFGFQLGLGVVTIVTTAMVYAMVAASFLVGSSAAGLAVGVAFGAIRGATVLPAGGVREPAALQVVSGRLVSWRAPVARFSVVIESAVLVVASLALAASI